MIEDPLDEAARALRDENDDRAAGDATLDRVLATVDAERLLGDAARAFYGTTESDGDGEVTLSRVLATLEGASDARRSPPSRRARALPWVAVAAAAMLAAVFAGPPALAWWRGAIAFVRTWNEGEPPAAHTVVRARRTPPAASAPSWAEPQQAPRTAPPSSPATRPARVNRASASLRAPPEPPAVGVETAEQEAPAPAEVQPSPIPTEEVPTLAVKEPDAVPAPPAPPAVVAPATPEATTSAAPVVLGIPHPSVVDGSLADRAERELFERAQRVHFGVRAAGDAVAAWDRYLASYPAGRFAPEARYNRALALVRSGRLDEARTALRPIATDHGYRAREARSLLDAIDAHP